MRHLVHVIDAMLGVIPINQFPLRAGLARVRKDALFTAPEAMGPRWLEASRVLRTHIVEPEAGSAGWVENVAQLYMGKASPPTPRPLLTEIL